ncbi:MAG: FkbM family methyltransferase [Gaiellaceae bacterium]
MTRRARLDTFLLDRVIRRPIVFTDDHGLRYVLYPGENAGVYIGSGGNYEVSEVRFCEQHLQPGGTLLDVGGNIGLYALLGAKLVGPAGRVHTFEPEQQNAARLRANVALNGFTNVEIFEAAVYSRPGNVSLNVFDSRFNAWHSLGRPELPDPEHSGRTVQPRETRDVPAVTLDEHCAAHALTGVDLLKIDVEGAEVDVLQGAERLLSERAVHAVMFEISLPQVEALGHASDEAFALLRAAGYECFRLRADGRLGPPVESASERYANYVALPSDA